MGSPRPIVYSARYYTSPRLPERRSYFHLWRCEPDGSKRRQITDARADDREPRWSPRGADIAFVRSAPEFRERLGPRTLCVCDPAGTVRELMRGDDLSFHWMGSDSLRVEAAGQSYRIRIATGRRQALGPTQRIRAISPNFRYALVEDPPGILRLGDDARIALPADVDETVWLTSTRILGLRKRDEGGYQATVGIAEFGLDGKVRREGKPILSDAARRETENSPLQHCHLETLPGQPDAALLGSGFGGTSTGWWYEMLRVDLKTFRAEPWAQARDPSFSLDARRFVTTYDRELAPYGKTGRELWVQGLRVARTDAPAKQRTIVGGLVHVQSAHWRPR